MNCLTSRAPQAAVPPHLLVGCYLRPAQAGDGRCLHAVCYSHLPRDAFLAQFERAYSWQQAGRGLYLVAELERPSTSSGGAPPAAQPAEARLIGCGQLLCYPHSAEIAELFVALDYRNKGVGTSLILQLLATAVAWRLPAVEISVTRDNKAAQRLYQRLGFVLDRELKLPGSGETAVVLRWEITLTNDE
jgi:ribosomal protein S18 acetylase RimI-like enzyme